MLRGSLDDLGGDHLVLRVTTDENTLEPYMYVDRVPLASGSIAGETNAFNSGSNSVDPMELTYAWSLMSTRQSGGNRGWLSNLASEMRSEQETVDRLYPLSAAQEEQADASSSWSCPLLRMAFWSQVFALLLMAER